MSSARRSFAPTLRFTLLALLLAAGFVRLGWWQWQRGEQRQVAAARFARGADQLLTLGALDAAAVPLYQRVSVEGELDGAHQFLLDNRSFEGRPGYEVLTPLTRGRALTLLIDRGWVPFQGSRAQLPDVTLALTGPVRLTGRIALLPTMTQLAAALGAPLSARVLLLDPLSPFGYARGWQVPGLPPLRHFAYAVQWWSFALLTLILWVIASRRPPAVAAP